MALRSVTLAPLHARALAQKRFAIAQDPHHHENQEERLAVQRQVAFRIRDLAALIDSEIEDGREKSVVFTKLEEALMWAGKAIFS